MRNSLVSIALVSAAGVLACDDHAANEAAAPGSAALLSAPAPAYYEVYRKGDPATDQPTGAPGSRSYLVGTSKADADVGDEDFAENVARPALAAGAGLFMTLNQCYGGGFLDNLAGLNGSQLVFTAARHSETAAYGYGAPSGVDIDSTDAFLIGLGDGHVRGERVARDAVAVNPFGPNPNAKRIDEQMGSEHAQLLTTGGGADLVPAAHAASGLAVLWAGQPAARDGAQMKTMIDRLLSMGYSRDRVWLLYGDGLATAEQPIIAAHVIGQTTPVHFRAATRKQLVDLFAQTFAPARTSKPDFIFLYVGDHGGLNSARTAKPGFEPDTQVGPNAKNDAPLYGAGDADLR